MMQGVPKTKLELSIMQLVKHSQIPVQGTSRKLLHVILFCKTPVLSPGLGVAFTFELTFLRWYVVAQQ